MRDPMIDLIFQPRATLFEFFSLLVSGKLDLFFNTIDRFVQSMIFLKESPELVAARFEALDQFAMLRKLPQDRMVKVHMRFSG